MGVLCASVVNTDADVTDWFQARWPGSLKAVTGLGPRQKPATVWTVAARRAAVFLAAIEPYVVRRRVRERIALSLEFQRQKGPGGRVSDEYREDQWTFYLRMRDLNVRGVPIVDNSR